MGEFQLLLNGTLVLAAPLIFAAIGGFFSERSGVINIALEGKMLISAVTVYLVAIATGSAVVGVAGGVAAAVLLSLLHWLLTQKFKIDPIVSGMAINALAFGAANFLDKKFTNPNQSGFPKLPTFLFWGFALLLPFIVWLYVQRTRGGLRLLAVGSDPDKARQMGVFPHRIRCVSLLATGVCCGLAGALIVTNAGSYTDNMTAGRGFIALAALIIGGWRPLPSLIACIAFGMFQQLQIQLQGTKLLGLELPRELWLCLPYVVTIVALAGLLGKNRTPSGLGKP